MRLSSLLFAIALPACVVVGILGMVTQPFVTPLASTPPEVDPVRLEEHVSYLSKDLYPRSYEQSRNIELAAAYIQRALEASGGEVSLQEVSVRESRYKNVIARFGPSTGPVLVVGGTTIPTGTEMLARASLSGILQRRTLLRAQTTTRAPN